MIIAAGYVAVVAAVMYFQTGGVPAPAEIGLK
jgi:hypothetical protein